MATIGSGIRCAAIHHERIFSDYRPSHRLARKLHELLPGMGFFSQEASVSSHADEAFLESKDDLKTTENVSKYRTAPLPSKEGFNRLRNPNGCGFAILIGRLSMDTAYCL